jgi:hypothetical protein
MERNAALLQILRTHPSFAGFLAIEGWSISKDVFVDNGFALLFRISGRLPERKTNQLKLIT